MEIPASVFYASCQSPITLLYQSEAQLTNHLRLTPDHSNIAQNFLLSGFTYYCRTMH